MWALKTATTLLLIVCLIVADKIHHAGRVLAVSGALINLYHYYVLRSGSGNFVTRGGLYRWVRHPMYLGELILTAGLAFAVQTVWAYALLAINLIAILRLSFCEDIQMLLRYGNDHRHWVMRTKRLIPYVY